MGFRPTLFTYITHLLVLHSYASYIKTLIYILSLWNTILLHSVFLTWYQSYCSNFLVSCNPILVFSTALTSLVSKPFSMLSLNYSTAIKGTQGWIFAARSSISATKTTASVGFFTSEPWLGHKTYHRVYFQLFYTTPLEKSSSDQPRAAMCPATSATHHTRCPAAR